MAPRRAALVAGSSLVAGGVAAWQSTRPSLMPWPRPAQVAVAVVSGLGGALAGAALGGAAALTVPRRRADEPAADAGATVRRAVGLTLAGVTAGTVVAQVVKRGRGVLLERLLADGRGTDPGFATPPTDDDVSGSPASYVDHSSLGREGRRFVGTATTADVIAAVTGRPPRSRPVRVFVGWDSAATIDDRVDLAIRELERTGGFDRSWLLVESPAGTGYANPTPVDAIELYTGGDVASVAVAYGLLPSFLSLSRVPIAAETQHLLLQRIHEVLADRPVDRRPRLLLYGESLGAKVQQAALPAGLADLDRIGVHRALWVGTPGGREADAFRQRLVGNFVTLDRPEQIPVVRQEVPDARVWFLEHDGDPVHRFRPEVVARRPEWLAPDLPRGRGVPEDMHWRPGVTWVQLLADTIYATDVKPGDFRSEGHDYRADLAAVVAAAYGLDADPGFPALLDRVEERLRTAERDRAARIEG
ncbi:MAG: alpha/beta-hydrolase family protein [Candidatus Nanopelagicales bacterium]